VVIRGFGSYAAFSQDGAHGVTTIPGSGDRASTCLIVKCSPVGGCTGKSRTEHGFSRELISIDGPVDARFMAVSNLGTTGTFDGLNSSNTSAKVS
jgi:hypothetical protein